MPSNIEPSVTRIHVEYADGSSDEIKMLQSPGIPLYDLRRKRANADVRGLGPHTSGAIAVILFRTAITTRRTEYPFHDPKLFATLRQWYEETKPNDQKPEET